MRRSPTPSAVRISSAGATWALGLSVAGLVGLALLGGLYEFAAGKPAEATVANLLIGLVDLDSETSVATWFSVIVLAAAAVASAVAGACEADRAKRRRWWGLAVAFSFLSIDEASEIHERVTPLTQAALNLNPDGALRFAWILPYGAATVVFVVLFARFMSSLPSGTRRRLIIGLGLYVAGALGVEALSGWVLSVQDTGALTGLLIVAEETLEMTGAALMLLSVLWHLEHLGGSVTFGGVGAARGDDLRQLGAPRGLAPSATSGRDPDSLSSSSARRRRAL